MVWFHVILIGYSIQLILSPTSASVSNLAIGSSLIQRKNQAFDPSYLVCSPNIKYKNYCVSYFDFVLRISNFQFRKNLIFNSALFKFEFVFFLISNSALFNLVFSKSKL